MKRVWIKGKMKLMYSFEEAQEFLQRDSRLIDDYQRDMTSLHTFQLWKEPKGYTYNRHTGFFPVLEFTEIGGQDE